MQKMIYVPPSGSYSNPSTYVYLATAEPYILSSVTGVGGVEASIISSTIPGMDGAYMQGIRIEPREIPCTVYVHGNDRQDMYAQRYELIRKLTPTSKLGWLYYRNDYIHVRTQAIPRLPPDFTERIRNYNKAEISFWCPSPYWRSISGKSEEIGYIKGAGFKLPFSFPIKFASLKSEITIDYQGSVPAPVTITIYGSATKPKITNKTTGQYIAVEQALSETQRLVIVTTRGSKSVKIAETGKSTKDAFQYIDPESVFWELQPGENIISYDSGDDSQKTAVKIAYSEFYSGV